MIKFPKPNKPHTCPPRPGLILEKFTLHCDGVKRKIKWRRL